MKTSVKDLHRHFFREERELVNKDEEGQSVSFREL